MWEYKVIVHGNARALETEMNALAADGWEFVALSHTDSFDPIYTAVLKRRKP